MNTFAEANHRIPVKPTAPMVKSCHPRPRPPLPLLTLLLLAVGWGSPLSAQLRVPSESLLPLPPGLQRPVSIGSPCAPTAIMVPSLSLHPTLWTLPAGLITTGVVTLNRLEWSPMNAWVQATHGRDRQSLPLVDDIEQYLPLVTATTLRMCGVPGRSATRVHYLESAAIGGAIMGAVVLGTKALKLQQRPDGSSWNSFMSGHTATAFYGAEMLRIEYGKEYPYLAFMGYMAAITTGALRIHHQRHWAGDVIAGAGVGIASAWAGYLLQPYLDHLLQRLFSRGGR